MIRTLMLIAALLFAPAPSPTPDTVKTPGASTCTAIHALVGGELVPWLGYDNGGWNLPADLTRTARIDFTSGGVWERHSESERARYIWVFLSYRVDGTPKGAHDFCGPYKVHDGT